MKNSTPRQVAIFISLLATTVCCIAVIIYNLVNIQKTWLLAGISSLIIFIIVFYISFQALNNFLIEKIHPIYKTISSFTITEEILRERLKDKEIISQVNKKVIKWVKKKTKEIAKLKQLEKYRKDFLGNVSHELKTPIFNIQGYVLTLLDGGLDDPSINRLYLERTEKSINRMISIIEDLESISHLESGELRLIFEDFNMVQLIQEVLENHEMKAQEHNITLAFAQTLDKPIMVNADRKRIYEVVNNLVINSILYGKEGGRTMVLFLDMGEEILIEVTDDGIGIAKPDIPRIFERFYRTDKSRSCDQGGTGLGLSIVKHIIEAHNQTINVNSTPGIGSSFTFSLKKGKPIKLLTM